MEEHKHSKDIFISEDDTRVLLGCSCGEMEHGYVSHMQYEPDEAYLQATFNMEGFSFKDRLKTAWNILFKKQSLKPDFIVNHEALISLGKWAERKKVERNKVITEKRKTLKEILIESEK